MTHRKQAATSRPTADLAAWTATWWANEQAIRVSSIPSYIPALPDGRRVSTATAWRWTLRGLHGVRIRRFKVGGTWCTTTAELARWSAALTAAEVTA